MHRALGLIVSLTLLAACGGGGDGGAASQPDVFYVRASTGDDLNDGLSPATAFRTIGAALARLTDGDTVIVGPGTYREHIIDPRGGTSVQPVTFRADPTGELTGDDPDPVVIDGEGKPVTIGTSNVEPVIRLTRASFVIIDGFVVTGAAGTAGIEIRSSSSNVTVRHCQVVSNRTGGPDGIAVRDSDDVLLFNNLIFNNTGRGIAVVGRGKGSQRALLINNTIVKNRSRGIQIGTQEVNAPASKDAFLRNNIVQRNETGNIDIATGPPSSLDGFDSGFNLVFPLSDPFGYRPSNLPQATDIKTDALFVDERNGDLRLSRNSPAVDAGVEENLPGGPQAGFGSLRQRTTQSDGTPDTGRIDLGYHELPGTG